MIERKLINDNVLTVVGTLTDATINVSTAANGKDYVRGSVNVKSNDKTISLNFFTMKLTKDNTVSKLYNTYSIYYSKSQSWEYFIVISLLLL